MAQALALKGDFLVFCWVIAACLFGRDMSVKRKYESSICSLWMLLLIAASILVLSACFELLANAEVPRRFT